MGEISISNLDSSKRKGIIVAGGKGSRLYPITKASCKQLLPVFDKPMIYYPLTTLMMAGIREVLIVTNKIDLEIFKRLLGDGGELGMSIEYAVQPNPNGIVEAILIGEKFIDKSPLALILGDNIFHGASLIERLKSVSKKTHTSTIFAYHVSNPENFGVVEFTKEGEVINIEEKPKNPKTNFAIPGLYFYDNSVLEKSTKIKPSIRGELEITDLNKLYLDNKNLKIEILGRGTAWLDAGTFESLFEASSYIKSLETRHGLKVGCPEEIAWRNKWIDDEKLIEIAIPLLKSGYGEYLLKLPEEISLNF